MHDVNVNQRKLHRAGLTHVPSPRWYGALILLPLALSMATIFSYGLLDWPWQQDLGWWNHVVAAALMVAFAFALRLWRNDPRRRFTWGDDDSPAGQPV